MSWALGPTVSGAPPGASDVLALIVGGNTWDGWQRVSVTRSLDTVPASFDIELTEKYPNLPDVVVQAGEPCQVKIGADLVITGYVDRYETSMSAGNHTVRISGRSKSEDLVDCSAVLDTAGGQPGFQMMGGTTLSIAQALAKPYNVTISSTAGDGVTVPQFNINLGETAWEIIDRVTRYSKLLAYDLPDGSVELAQAGSENMASGFVLGSNAEQASVTYSMDQRFSDYEGHFLSTMVFGTDTGTNSPAIGQRYHDDGVPRFRMHYVISEQTVMGQPIAADRALWEMHRRAGRSQALNVTCDSWRDSAGALWAPNHMAPVTFPALKLAQATWIIAAVIYQRDETGQHARVTLMPKEAFDPEPVALQALPPLTSDVDHGNPTTPPGGPKQSDPSITPKAKGPL